jgi:hypothetical protein
MSFPYGSGNYSDNRYSWMPSWMRKACEAGAWVAQACRLDTRRNQDVPGNHDHAATPDPGPPARQTRGQWR